MFKIACKDKKVSLPNQIYIHEPGQEGAKMSREMYIFKEAGSFGGHVYLRISRIAQDVRAVTV